MQVDVHHGLGCCEKLLVGWVVVEKGDGAVIIS